MAFYANIANSNANTTVVGGKSIPAGGEINVTFAEYLKITKMTDPTTVAGITVTFLQTLAAGQIPGTQATDVEVTAAIAALNLGEIVPVDGVQSLLLVDPGVDGDDGVTYTAVEYGVDGDDITITHVDPGAEATLSVDVDGTDIVVNLASSAVPAVTSTAADIVAAIIASDDASALVTAVAQGTGLGLAAAAAEAPLAGGVDCEPEAQVGAYGFNAAGTELYVRYDEQTWKHADIAAL